MNENQKKYGLIGFVIVAALLAVFALSGSSCSSGGSGGGKTYQMNDADVKMIEDMAAERAKSQQRQQSYSK